MVANAGHDECNIFTTIIVTITTIMPDMPILGEGRKAIKAENWKGAVMINLNLEPIPGPN